MTTKPKRPQTNSTRLQRAIQTLQQLQRTNAPNTAIFKAAAKALQPLLKLAADVRAQEPVQYGPTTIKPSLDVGQEHLALQPEDAGREEA